MTGWWEDTMVSFDTESTGVDVHTDRLITAAVVYIFPDSRPRTLTWILDPGVDIPGEASEVNGWTRDKLRAAIGHPHAEAAVYSNGTPTRMSRSDALFALAGHLALAMSQKVPVVAFNAPFDFTLVNTECVRHGAVPLTDRLPSGLTGVVDPFVIDKHYSRRRGSRKVADQVKHYRVMLPSAHDAGSDALAAGRLVPRMVAAYPELQKMTLPAVHRAQVGWRAAQQDSLRDYFDKQNKTHDGCCGEWPLHVTCAPRTTNDAVQVGVDSTEGIPA